MNWWRWLTTPDPNPGYNTGKLLKLFVRVAVFAVLATLLSTLLMPTPVGKYLNTWWGSMLLVLVLYLPLMRFLSVDTFVPRRFQAPPSTNAAGKTVPSSTERRKEKNRYAGVRKAPPKYGGRR
ncbi:hypothetical protein D3875_10390 [Deinococcus cavernae]|uniref:Uncharacterized protein n=1 Tax=Deinococcus cavernae TaxID=2320857 RepID=A0A418V748_9DEIO|nr:hypothetical protein [Deinococcus cavernae]RJF71911.1 hypothetical protein D3875_10390 [Deinococcus cavernae]